MLLSRWKMMAGVLGVSLGGLVAFAGPCPKTDPTKGLDPTDVPATAAAMPPAKLPAIPNPPATIPPSLPVIPASGTLPALPDSGPVLPPPSTPPAPPLPSAVPPAPATDELPPLPMTRPATPPVDPLPAVPATPMAVPPAPQVVASPRAAAAVDPLVVPAAATVAQSRYRILLRVGEGEPIFEVRSGDDLLLKVVCEKVDVKSPEKGQGLSAVKASGKVRFSGFGAEGTCEELHFLAGTGEVGMTGSVKIQVKDKLGRIESELTTESMKYKIDPKAITGNGTLKP